VGRMARQQGQDPEALALRFLHVMCFDERNTHRALQAGIVAVVLKVRLLPLPLG
jgi:hypothetical protein